MADCDKDFALNCSLRQLCQRYKTMSESDRKVIDRFLEAVLDLDENTREAFIELFGKKRYGSFSLVFKAGECIGFDWKSSHRKH